MKSFLVCLNRPCGDEILVREGRNIEQVMGEVWDEYEVPANHYAYDWHEVPAHQLGTIASDPALVYYQAYAGQ